MDRGDLGLIAVWSGLVLLTLLSFEGAAQGCTADSLAIAAALGVALLKMRIVGRRFMELRMAPLGMRLLLDAWLAALGSALFVMWL